MQLGSAGSASSANEEILQEMWWRNNLIRAEVGLPPQTMNSALTQAAQDQALFMAAERSLSHDSNGGLVGRIRKFGYNYRSIRENIAWNQQSVVAVFDSWRYSPGHWDNLTGSEHDIGCGHALNEVGEPYWVVVYGSLLE
jgi:uncharacterized protein YkwD